MAEEAAAAAEPQQQDLPPPGPAAADGGGGIRRYGLWLLLVLPVGVMLVVSPLFLQDLDQQLFQRADERGAADCVKEDDCSTRDTSTCHREQCVMAASRIRTMLNDAADPCSNFYDFACGKWSESNSKIAPSFNTLQKHVNLEIQMLLFKESKLQRGPFEKLGKFYSSCLQSRSKDHAEDQMFLLLNQLGGFTQRSESHTVDLTKTIGGLLKLNGAPLFDVYIDSDINDKTKLAIYLDLPHRISSFAKLLKYDHVYKLWQRSFLLDNQIRRSARDDYKKRKAYKYLKAMADQKRLLQMEKLAQMFVPQSLSNRSSEIQHILLFVSLLSQIHPEEKEISRKLQMRHQIPMYPISMIQQNFDLIDWRTLFQITFESNVTDDTPVYVLAGSYFHQLINLSRSFDKSIIHNGLLLLFARDSLLELVNTTAVANLESFCAKVTTTHFTSAVSALYVRQYSQQYLAELQTRVTDLFEKLKNGLLGRIQDSQWLDDESKSAALVKLRELQGHFFTWPHFWNETYVHLMMEQMEINDNFFWNVIGRMKQLRTFNGSLDEQMSYTHEKRWAYPFVVNAFYEQSINSIVIPLAVLTEPYFQQDMPRYIPYGTMGLIFTHEILHAFDKLGIHYNERGENNPWLTESSKLAFEKRLECVAEQYQNAFVKQVPFMGTQIMVEFDWNVTINENMADISGLHVAFEAWRREQLHGGYSDQTLPDVNLDKDQLFFVSAAQTYCSSLSPEDYILLVELDFHTPFPERVNGIMMNSEEFAKAFQCPTGTPMNPDVKCFMW